MDQCYLCFKVQGKEELSDEQHMHLMFFKDLLDKRFERAVKNPDSPFFYASLSPMPLARDLDTATLMGVTYRGRSIDALHALLYQFDQAKALGFTDAEIETVRESCRGDLTQALSNLDKIPHKNFASSYQDHFLKGEKLVNSEDHIKWKLDLIENVTNEELIAAAQEYLEPSHFFVSHATAENQEGFEQEVNALFAGRESWSFAPQIEAVAQDFTVTGLTKTPIKSQEFDTARGVTTLKLANGMTVLLKPTDLKKDEIDMMAFAKGGYASLDEEVFNTAQLATPYFSQAGLNGFSGDELKDFFKSRQVIFDSGVSATKRELGGAVTKENLSYLFRAIHARFKESAFDDRTFSYLKRVYKEAFAGYENNPEALFSLYVKEVLHSHHPIGRRMAPDALMADQLRVICEMAFENPADFTIAFSGDFTVEEILPEIETYLGSIPASDFQWPTEIAFEYPFPKRGSQVEIFTKGHENKSMTIFQFLSPLKHKVDPYAMCEVKAAVHIFNRRLMKRFRQEEGESYFVNCQSGPCFDDFSQNLVVMNFPSDPGSYEKLMGIYEEERAAIASHPPSQEEVEKAIESFKNDKRVRLQTNSYWTYALLNALYYGYDWSFVDRFDHYEALTTEGVHDLMTKLFDYEHSMQITWVPEQ